jgi:hypothetical protein
MRMEFHSFNALLQQLFQLAFLEIRLEFPTLRQREIIQRVNLIVNDLHRRNSWQNMFLPLL